MSQIRAELRKLLGLPTARIGVVFGLLAAPVLVLINAPAARRALADGTTRDPSDLTLLNLGIGLIGAMVLGVVVMSSEYTSTGDDAPRARQLTATLTAMPHRLRLLTAKATALTLTVAAQGTITVIATIAVSRAVHGSDVPSPGPGRVLGAVLFWVLTALLAFALTVLTRTGIVPLTLLIVNSSVVSVSYLLTKLTPAAAYLPDIVGAHMFIRDMDAGVHIAPVVAGLVMTAWVAALLAVAAYVFHRRDAT